MSSPTQIGLSNRVPTESQPGRTRFFAFLVLTGLLNALIAAFLFLHLPENHAPSLGSLIRRAVIFVVFGALAGTAGSWFYWRTSDSPFRANPPIPFRHFALVCAACWIWVPAFVLLSREDSPLTGPIAILAAALLAFSLRKALPPAAKPTPPTEDGLFAATLRTPPWQWSGYLIALAVYAAGYELANRWIIDGSCLLACAAFLFAWNRTLAPPASSDPQVQARRAARRLAWAIIPAILITLFTLLYGIGHRNRLEADAALAAARVNPASGEDAKQDTTTPASANGIPGYQSVILWPVLDKKQIVPPIPQPVNLLAPGTTKPLVIRFDGPYYYFQPPHKVPSLNAHQAHGTPLAVDIKTNNFVSLIMQAHQKLGVQIPVARCRELQVDVLNHDNTRGTVRAAVFLTDSAQPDNQLYLGQQTLLSSQPEHFTVKAAPIAESLHFAIPTPARIRKFDQITVMLLPDTSNYDRAPKVAIDQFQIQPR